MYVCLCRGVTDRTIRRLVQDGARSCAAVARRCGAGTACGSCREDVAALVRAAEGPPKGADWCVAEDALAAK